MDIDGRRSSGILMHITSLPSQFGIGDLGPDAYSFAHDAKESGARLWQMLPLGPTGYGNSPYSQRSAFAGNEMLISPSVLRFSGLLSDNDLQHPYFPSSYVDFKAVWEWKMPILRKAAKQALKKAKILRAIEEFRERESFWIEDYALFMAIHDRYNDARWESAWKKEEAERDSTALSSIREKHRKDIDIYIALQYFFSEQMKALKEHCSSLGLKIIGDVPLYAGSDSADVWTHRELFRREKAAGVPPDCFSPTGQLWGNPVYRWKEHEKTGFEWWKERIRRALGMADIIRIDHFRGLSSYYEIEKDAASAEHGIWRKSPGKKLLGTLLSEFSGIDIIAEDLGWMTDDVRKLRDSFSIPGMKIAQFGFSRMEDGYLNTYDDFLPHNYTRPFAAYTGNHDNNTTRGWFCSLSDIDRHIVREYLGSADEDIVWALIRSVMMSNADTVIIPMQDILELGEDARMNYPSTCNSRNWSWRMEKGSFNPYRKSRFSFLSRISGRNGLTADEWKKKKEPKLLS